MSEANVSDAFHTEVIAGCGNLLPLGDATVNLLITRPESLTLVTGPSNAEGISEVTWNTQAPRKNNPGKIPGVYTVTVKGVTLTGYHWDSVTPCTSFTIQ